MNLTVVQPHHMDLCNKRHENVRRNTEIYCRKLFTRWSEVCVLLRRFSRSFVNKYCSEFHENLEDCVVHSQVKDGRGDVVFS